MKHWFVDLQKFKRAAEAAILRGGEMKQEVDLSDVKVRRWGPGTGDVTLTRAQVEAAMKELDAPVVPKFKAGDIVKSGLGNRFIVLSSAVSRIVADSFNHSKGLKDPLTLMGMNEHGGTATFERSSVEKNYEKVDA